MSTIIQKIFSNYLFRVMAAWFGVYIKEKVAASILEPVQEAQQIADQTIAEAQGIADTFTIRNVGSQDNVEGIVNAFARQPGEGETADTRLVTQDWNDGQGSISHTVYATTMYIGGEEVTV